MKILIDKAGAPETIKTLIQFACTLPHANAVAQMAISTNAMQNHFILQGQSRADADEILKKFKQAIDWFEKSRAAQLEQIHISVKFGNSANDNAQIVLKRCALSDEITLNHQGSQGDANANIACQLLDKLWEHYKPKAQTLAQVPETRQLSGLPQDIVIELAKRITDSAADLSYASKEGLNNFLHHIAVANQKLTTDIAAEYEKMRAQAAAERADIAKEQAEQQAKLEQKRDVELQKLEAERQALSKEREAFLEEKKKFDDNNNRHMRRVESNKMLAKLDAEKQVVLSDETNKKARPILWGCIILGALALAGAVFSGCMILNKGSIAWYQVIPFTTSVLIFVSTALYYLRWQNTWLSRHADLETRNQLLRVDVLRASWFAELLFEFKDEKQATVPESVIQAMTKNLFELKTHADSAKHPVDDVTNFLSRMNRVRLGPNEVEMESDTKGSTRKAKSSRQDR